MKVRYTETAAAEVAEIFEYVAARNPKAASDIVTRLERLLHNLGNTPLIARTTDELGTHVIPVGRYPYLVFYAVEGDAVVILHVRHSARRHPER